MIAVPHRILVTGAAGFVGGWLLGALPPGARVAAPSIDVRDEAAVDALVRELQPTGVVHLAALSHVQESRGRARETFDVNLTGTMVLAEAVLRYAPAARFLFVGSSEAYGGTFNAWSRALDESAPLDPANPYAASKAAADVLIGQMARDGLQAVRFRPFNHTGPGQSPRFAVPAFAQQIARIERGLQEPELRTGNLEPLRDFLDVRDVVAAYVAALTRPEPLAAGTIVNLASGVPRRIGDILRDLCALARAPVRVVPDPARMRPNDTPLAAGDAARARELLGWRPRIAWSQTLADVLEAAREASAA